MSRTVDTSSTFEDWRQKYNDLAGDVGGLTNLRTPVKASLVDAVNFIQDQYFFFQDFDYDGSDGATSNTVFSGADNGSNVLQYSAGKLLVFKNGALLRSGTDYTATNGTSVVLGSSASNSDVIRITSFTGSYEGVGGAGATSGSADWQLAGGVLFNKNTDGIIFNADTTINNNLEHSNSFQFENIAYFKDTLTMKSVGNQPTEIRFGDNDNSHSVGLRAPATISTNYSLLLPTADGSSGQFLRTDGSGQLSFGTVSATAPDVNVTANNSANETVFPVFVDGATGTQGLESDSGFTYNPSSGALTSTTFVGALTGNASGSAHTLAVSQNFSITGDVTASAIGFNGTGAVALSASLAANTVDSSELVDGSIDTSHIANSQVTVAKMAANSVDSDQYVDGSIDTAHIADNVVTAAKIAISGNGSSGQAILSDGDGSFSYGSSGKTTEEIQDIVGAMFSSNTETRVSATYQDGDGTIDLVVDDMTANTNTQLSDAQVRSKLSAGTGISYNNSTGVITNSSTNTDTLPSAGTGISVSGATVTNAGVTSIVAGSRISISGGTGAVTVTASSQTANDFTTTLKNKLDGIAANATNTTATDNNFTTTLKNKLDGIAASATNTTQGFVNGTGNALTASTGTFHGAITSTGDITAFLSSDSALKENFSPITQALYKVSQIGGYEFDWKDHKDINVVGEGHDVGIIAQEIEKVLPEVVMTRANGRKAVNYTKIIPLLIESIKELKTELDDLKSSKT